MLPILILCFKENQLSWPSLEGKLSWLIWKWIQCILAHTEPSDLGPAGCSATLLGELNNYLYLSEH